MKIPLIPLKFCSESIVAGIMLFKEERDIDPVEISMNDKTYQGIEDEALFCYRPYLLTAEEIEITREKLKTYCGLNVVIDKNIEDGWVELI